MNDFDDALMKAMRRVDAPEGFAEQVRARVEAESAAASAQVSKSRPGAPRWSMPRAWFGAAGFATAALLLVGLVTGERVHERHERAALATQQFETATRITDKAMEHTREQLAKAGVALE